MTFSVFVDDPPKARLFQLDHSLKIPILKKLKQLERDDLPSRHLQHGLPYFVEDVSGFRIAFTKDDGTKVKKVWFIGDHKEYEKWFRSVDV